jgi:transposase
MTKATKYPPELRERAMRLVREHRDEHPSEWAAIESIAKKLWMTPETLRKWLSRAVHRQAAPQTACPVRLRDPA